MEEEEEFNIKQTQIISFLEGQINNANNIQIQLNGIYAQLSMIINGYNTIINGFKEGTSQLINMVKEGKNIE